MRPARRAAPIAIFFAALLLAAPLTACGKGTPKPSDVTFLTEDGFRLAATEYGTGENGVVLVHDAIGSRGDWEVFANLLASKGMKVIAMNLRGYPGSDGVRDIQVMDRDVVGAARYLKRERGVKKVAYVGAAMGGTIVFKAAANPDPQPSSFVAVSAPPKFDALDASKSIMQLFMPKMLVESAEDQAALDQARETFKAFPDPKRLEEVPGTLRAMALINADSSDGLRKTMADYLKSNFA